MDRSAAQLLGHLNPEPYTDDEAIPLLNCRRTEQMPTEDEPSESRITSPSVAERVRSLTSRSSHATSPFAIMSRNFDSHDEDSDPSREGSMHGPGEAFTRPSSTPDAQYRETALQTLNQSNSIDSRMTALIYLSQNIAQYAPSTIMTIIGAAQHLGETSAEPNVRKAFFNLVASAATNSALSSIDRRNLFTLVSYETPASIVYHQVKALKAITKDSADLTGFENSFTSLLPVILQKQWPQTAAARRRNRNNAERLKSPLDEDKGLFSLLDLAANTLEYNSGAFSDSSLDAVVSETLQVAEKTASKRDMERALLLVRAVIDYSKIPGKRLRSCIEILCGVSNAISDLLQTTEECFTRLMQTEHREAVVNILLETLALAPTDRHTHTVGGALIILEILVSGDDDNNNLPHVSFSKLIESLDEVHYASRQTRRNCLRAINTLLSRPTTNDAVFSSNWDLLVKVILTATGDAKYTHDRTSEALTIRTALRTSTTVNHTEEDATNRGYAEDIVYYLGQIALFFNEHWHGLTPEQKEAVGLFYFKLRLILPSSIVSSLIRQLSREAYFDPGTEDWRSHQIEILRLYVWDQDADSEICIAIIDVLKEAASIAQDRDYEHFHMIILRLINSLENQLTLQVANELAKFATATWKKWQPSRFDETLKRFWPLLNVRDATSEGNGQAWAADTKLNEVPLLFVELFLAYFQSHAEQTIQLYEFMTEVAKANGLAPSVRIPVLRLLARLRCDSLGRIIVAEIADSLGLAATLSRTESTIGPIGRYSFDRVPTPDEPPPSRQSRTSATFNTRASRIPDRSSRVLPTPPLWMYPGAPGLPQTPPSIASPVLSLHAESRPGLKMGEWLIAVIDILQQSGHWEIYSYIIVHLPSQLSQHSLFAHEKACIKHLRNVIVSQLLSSKFQDAPSNTNVSKGDVALCLYQSLTMLLAYSDLFSRSEQDDIVRAFLLGIGGWERTARTCIQSLAVCCHQIPWSITRTLTAIVQKMSQIITQSNLAIDILEFLGGLARLPDIYTNFREEEFRTVFAVCTKYLEHAREQRQKLSGTSTSEADYNSNRMSGISVKSATAGDSGHSIDVHQDLPQYVFALAYHVITVWFLSLKLTDRASHVGWITANLAWKDTDGHEYMEEQSQVTLDMMHRVSYLDLGESSPASIFNLSDGVVLKKNWIIGLSIVTIETATGTGLTQIIKRQASGTTYGIYQQHTAPLPAHHVPLSDDSSSRLHGAEARLNVFPNHILLQLTSNIAPTPIPMEPICLPDDDFVKRAISTFDRNDTVDGYRVGVIYIANGQKEESEILANIQGSPAFDFMLEGLGTKVPLQHATFNTQGLDKEMSVDGTHTYAWRDRVAEIVFHVPTMMPTNLEHDPSCVRKKSHIGNDFVNIIFNESGLPFKFDTFPSQFNCVNVVVTPNNKPFLADNLILDQERRTTEANKDMLYIVQTMSQPSFPLISPAASYKVLPLVNLPSFVRQLALQSSVFSNVWTQRAGGEVISSWRNRLREIHKLRERHLKTNADATTKASGVAKGSRAYVDEETSSHGSGKIKTYANGDPFKGRVLMGGLAEEEGVMAGLDFSRWAGPNPSLS